MAELNFRQITDRLNGEFTGNTRRLIFWYDANADFVEDVDSMELTNARVLHLEKDNQFYVKYFLERVDTETNYLIYAPFPKPELKNDHLADTLRYSKEFFADRASLICLELDISEQNRSVIQKYLPFFGSRERFAAFCALNPDCYTANDIENAILSVLCRLKNVSFADVLRCVLSEGEGEENRFLAEFRKYGIEEAFWQHCGSVFGYLDPAPSTERLIMTLFVTAAGKTIRAELPDGWKPFLSDRTGNVQAFLENLMNSVIYGGDFDALSARMEQTLRAEEILERMSPEDIADCGIFAAVDRILIRWMTARLEAEDVQAKLNGRTIPELCADRRKTHFGARCRNEYLALENAYELIAAGPYSPVSSAATLAANYTDRDYRYDRWYRQFCRACDQLQPECPAAFEKLRELTENIYTNDFLNRIAVNWSECLADCGGSTGLCSQLDFYEKYVKPRKERVVVIFSDALRYEVGRSLLERLQNDEKCTAEISAMQSVLPSVTAFGMAALLPHGELTIDGEETVLCGGQPCASLKQREAILQSDNPNGICVQFDEIKSLKTEELRQLLVGREVVLVYHNQIDARGDKPASENEVFTACDEAAEEIVKLIRDLTSKSGITHYLITADHGFLYKRDKLDESDKIGGIPHAGKRYALSDTPVLAEGVVNLPLSLFVKDPAEKRFVCSPIGTDLFKAPGAGLNYVHGGCSPQEMILPVLEVKTERNRVATTNASIDLISLSRKITNLNINLDFLQKEAVSDTVKETTYRVFFVDAAGGKISNENLHHADSREKEATKRVFKLKFSFMNQTYYKDRKYYLVAVDEKTGLETMRHEVTMDLAFAGNFGFGI